MSLVQATLIDEGDAAGLDATNTSWKRSYWIYTTAEETALTTMNGASGLSLPVRGSTSGILKVVPVNCEFDAVVTQAPNGSAADKRFRYTVEYVNPEFVIFDDPEDDLPEISGSGGGEEEYVNYDVNGDPIVNSAGDFYENVPPKPRKSATINVTISTSTNPASTAANFSRTRNSATIWGQAAGTVYMGDITFNLVRQVRNGTSVTYWRVTFPLKFSPEPWVYKPIDYGYNKTGKVPILDKSGQPVSSPVPLDGSGDELTGGGSVYFPTDGYQLIEDADFSTLGLPNPLT